MLNIILKLSDVLGPIWINLFAVFVANSIIEMTYQLSAFVRNITSITCDWTIQELASILISVVKIYKSFPCDQTLLKFTFINTALIVKSSWSVQKTVTELTLVLKLFVVPKILTFPIKKSILKLTDVLIAIRLSKFPFALNNIRKHLALVNTFNAIRVSPTHFTKSMHLCIYELTYVVTTVRPLKYTKSINLTLNKITSIYIDVVKFFSLALPLFETFPVYMPVFKITT